MVLSLIGVRIVHPRVLGTNTQYFVDFWGAVISGAGSFKFGISLLPV